MQVHQSNSVLFNCHYGCTVKWTVTLVCINQTTECVEALDLWDPQEYVFILTRTLL